MLLSGAAGMLGVTEGSGVAARGAIGNAERSGHVEGLYVGDTRCLSVWSLTVDGVDLESAGALLGRDHRTVAAVPSTLRNVPPGYFIVRAQQVRAGGLTDEISVRSASAQALRLTLRLALAADFADQFEVRSDGRTFDRSAASSVVHALPDGLQLTYRRAREGLDFARQVRVCAGGAAVITPIDGPGARVVGGELSWTIQLEPEGTWDVRVDVDVDTHVPGALRFQLDRPAELAADNPGTGAVDRSDHCRTTCAYPHLAGKVQPFPCPAVSQLQTVRQGVDNAACSGPVERTAVRANLELVGEVRGEGETQGEPERLRRSAAYADFVGKAPSSNLLGSHDEIARWHVAQGAWHSRHGPVIPAQECAGALKVHAVDGEGPHRETAGVSDVEPFDMAWSHRVPNGPACGHPGPLGHAEHPGGAAEQHRASAHEHFRHVHSESPSRATRSSGAHAVRDHTWMKGARVRPFHRLGRAPDVIEVVYEHSGHPPVLRRGRGPRRLAARGPRRPWSCASGVRC